MVSRRALEIFVAALTGSFGAAILVSSISIGAGWTARGPGSGAFPAIAGALIVGGSVYNLLRGLALAPEPAIGGPQLRKVAGMLLPAVAFVAVIPLVGLHVAAGLYIFGVVIAHRQWATWKAIALGIATPLALYAVFDWAFQVALPRGLLGTALGF
jgi:hypothetical protein